jgi:hypothetical protein
MANSGNKDPPALPPGGRCGRGVSSSSFRPRRFVLILVVLVVLVVSSSSFRIRRFGIQFCELHYSNNDN